MSNEIASLALYFDAPLLSFGIDSKFDRRDTCGFPTRSTVTGLVAAAMGIARNDKAALQKFAELQMLSMVYLSENTRLLSDFQTIGGNPPTSDWVPGKADGGCGKTVVTDRQYLSDGHFAAVLSGDRDLLESVCKAMLDPVWGGWIGRKNCIPATPICQGIFADEKAAIDKLQGLQPQLKLRIWEECRPGEPYAQQYFDVPIDFAERRFAIRAVVER